MGLILLSHVFCAVSPTSQLRFELSGASHSGQRLVQQVKHQRKNKTGSLKRRRRKTKGVSG